MRNVTNVVQGNSREIEKRNILFLVKYQGSCIIGNFLYLKQSLRRRYKF